MADELDTPAAMVSDTDTPFFDRLKKDWEDQATVREYQESVHRRELAAAGQAPVVNVTIAGEPGHYTADTGTGQVTYSPGPAPGADGPLTVAG
jgi:hypothetical protein